MPEPRPRPELMKGDSGSAVKLLQELLDIAIDGKFGDQTEAVVKDFQLSSGLKPDGIVGSLTWIALDGGKNAAKTFSGNNRLQKVIDLDAALKDPDSLISIAIGHAEGNRSINGSKAPSYFGHIDPGNGVQNMGTFSVQERIFKDAKPGQAFTPQAADAFWLERLRGIQAEYMQKVTKTGLEPGLAVLAASFFDLFTQSPGAATFAGGFLDQLPTFTRQELTQKIIVQVRVQSFFDPRSGKLDAPGFGNSLSRLTADQERRTNALIAVITQ